MHRDKLAWEFDQDRKYEEYEGLEGTVVEFDEAHDGWVIDTDKGDRVGVADADRLTTVGVRQVHPDYNLETANTRFGQHGLGT